MKCKEAVWDLTVEIAIFHCRGLYISRAAKINSTPKKSSSINYLSMRGIRFMLAPLLVPFRNVELEVFCMRDHIFVRPEGWCGQKGGGGW